jgi:predicted nucleic acid-binding protein
LTLYAESSAVLAWLLGQAGAAEARESLASADAVVASDLTMVECDRVLIRATALGELAEAEAASRRAELNAVAMHWTLLRLAGEAIDRARQRFPLEPIRTLDALHLACALVAKSAVPDVVVLSLDDQVRRNARALGFDLLPADDRLGHRSIDSIDQ